jgi:hypothetical protein
MLVRQESGHPPCRLQIRDASRVSFERTRRIAELFALPGS